MGTVDLVLFFFFLSVMSFIRKLLARHHNEISFDFALNELLLLIRVKLRKFRENERHDHFNCARVIDVYEK